MNNEYTTPEIVEIGMAQALILGGKGSSQTDEETGFDADADFEE